MDKLKTWTNWLRNALETGRGKKRNLQPLDGLRGFAILLVFINHIVVLFSPWLPQPSATYAIARFLQLDGRAGVYLFFFLSGYLIYGMLIDRPRPFWKFISRRVQRIYPTYFVILLIYIGLSYIFPAESRIPSQPGQAALYVLANLLLLPGTFNIMPIISVTWTLSLEMLFYLTMPLIIAVFRLRSWQPKWRIVFSVFLAFMVLILYVGLDGIGEHIRMMIFFAGAALYDTLKVYPSWAKVKGTGLLALAISFLIVPLLPQTPAGAVQRTLVFLVAIFVLYLDCVANLDSLTARLFSWKPMRWFGNISYSYFLIHGLTLQFLVLLLARILPPQGDSAYIFWIGLPITFLISIFPTIILFLTVERPYSLLPAEKRRPSTGLEVPEGTKSS
jgi:peptidoglycan/LPS O-acetylase OafA/YrhL